MLHALNYRNLDDVPGNPQAGTRRLNLSPRSSSIASLPAYTATPGRKRTGYRVAARDVAPCRTLRRCLRSPLPVM